ncbi:ATP-binding cassette domain-containing protein [Singulisphaera sp. PoT]|uniref:ATP-binding cassette domain-containing protein n=1 Tax=Singulisphaera sp. PoT TaxID=3411797 RepID=UPI003BF4CDDA
MALLSLRNVSLAFGGPRLLDGVELQIERGERVCLLGRNGEGKSTLLRLLQGQLAPDEGEVIRQQGLRVARLTQDVPQDLTGDIAEVVAQGLDAEDSAGPHDHRVEAVISRMGLDATSRFEALSSGMKRRVLLAQAIVAEPDILLLDEPTNHLDIEAIRWLEEFLPRAGLTLIFVTHDRVFLGKLATRILELDRGHLFDWSCDYATFLARKEDLLAAESRHNSLFDKKLAQEEVWIRKGVEARRTRNEGRVRALKALREARSQRRDRQGTARMKAQEAERSGTMVIEAKGVSFGYAERTVIKDLTTTITRGDKIGIIGPNGSGKTTLLRLLLGKLTPPEGSIRLGTNLEIAYFDQLKATLDEEKTVQENVADGYDTIYINGQPRHVLGYLQDFLFPPDRSRSLIRFLSGGERSRLLLAKLFTKPSNVLVLDEPTNDLDMETLELLESLLVDYQGTVLLVSHDRAFLNDVVTSTLAIDAQGQVKEYDGGYDDFIRQRSQEEKVEPAAEASATKAAEKPREKTRKLSFKEQREMEALPGKIDVLETTIAGFHEAMADPSYYRKSSDEIAKSKAELDAAEADLAAAYARWEELESLGNA